MLHMYTYINPFLTNFGSFLLTLAKEYVGQWDQMKGLFRLQWEKKMHCQTSKNILLQKRWINFNQTWHKAFAPKSNNKF